MRAGADMTILLGGLDPGGGGFSTRCVCWEKPICSETKMGKVCVFRE